MAIGAVLSQEVDGARQPVAFVFRTLTNPEKKSSVYELECLAVVFALDKFRRYLEHAEFLLETDNQALSWLLAHPRQLGKLGRWVVKISSFRFRAQHIRGTQNVVADALSRMYHLPSEEPINEPCALLLEFPLAFTEVIPHQLDDEVLGPIIDKIKSGEMKAPYHLSKGVLCSKERRGRVPKICLLYTSRCV